MNRTSERQVPREEWQDSGGFVKVRGEYVAGGYGVSRVPVRLSDLASCQGPCHQVNVPLPLVLWVRWENGLDRLMYWFAPLRDAPRKWRCDACEAGTART